MDAEEVQNHTGDQQKLIDVCVTPSVKIGKLQLLHSFRSFTCRGWTEADAAGPISINFQNHIVVSLILPAVFIASKAHHHFVKPKNISLAEVDMLISRMNFIQGVPVPGDLRLVVVQRGTVLIDNSGNTLIACNNALDSIGALDRLYLCDSFQFRKNLRVFFPAHACHGFQRSYT